MRTFLEKLMFFILISMYLMGQQVEVFTIFLGLCIFIFSLSMEVFENSWIQRIALVISGALCIVFPECVLYISIFIMHAAQLFGPPGIFTGVLLLLRPNLLTLLLTVIGTYLILRSSYDKRFRIKSHLIQDDLEHERLILLQRQQFSQEETLKQMEVATLKERNRISHALHDQIGHTLSASIMQLEALQIITNEPVVEKKLEQVSGILQSGMNEIRSTIHNLYDDSFLLSQKMDEILHPLEKKAQVNYQNTISDEIPIGLKYDILTICKEMITNFMKYSNGNQLQLFLLEQNNYYTIQYKDNGNKTHNITPGMGLTMMKELVEKHKGVMTLQTTNGYDIFIRIPKQEEHHD